MLKPKLRKLIIHVCVHINKTPSCSFRHYAENGEQRTISQSFFVYSNTMRKIGTSVSMPYKAKKSIIITPESTHGGGWTNIAHKIARFIYEPEREKQPQTVTASKLEMSFKEAATLIDGQQQLQRRRRFK